MITTLLFLATFLDPSEASTPAVWAYQAAPAYTLPSLPAGATSALSEQTDYQVFLPLAVRSTSSCEPIPGVQYDTLDVNGSPTDRPAEEHADLNLALRGYQATSAYLGLVTYGGYPDPAAPQLYTLFADQRVPAFAAAYQVYDWDWDCNCRAGLIAYPEVTLVGMSVAPGEVLHLPDSGCNIGSGYDALVLYASEERITFKYTREDNVVAGYTIHVENICVEPSLLALYRASNAAGRSRLPALRGGQPFGRARGDEIRVVTRDTGSFMDPRSRRDWWQSK